VESGEIGVFGRFRLSKSFILEGELSRSETEDATRVDRSVGAALLYEFRPYRALSPYVLAGLGATGAEAFGGAATAAYGYGEVGAGLSYQLTPRVSVLADLRGGSRHADMHSIKSDAFAVEEEYWRVRLGGLLHF
jgi:opacity protein-like surface antigen